MILLNKSINTQDIVLTLSELTTIGNPVYLLVLTNDFTKAIFRIVLQNNISLNTARYDHYQVPTSAIATLEQGTYTYSVYQSSTLTYDESLLGKSIEDGKAQVIDPIKIVQPITYNSEPTEFLTYNSDND